MNNLFMHEQLAIWSIVHMDNPIVHAWSIVHSNFMNNCSCIEFDHRLFMINWPLFIMTIDLVIHVIFMITTVIKIFITREPSIFSRVLTKGTGCPFSRPLANRRPQSWLTPWEDWMLSYNTSCNEESWKISI